MCAAFLAWLKLHHPDWTPYAETEGWDILLVHADATQIGIQAKLKFNMAVLQQAVEDGLGWAKFGPDYRAVLVPGTEGSNDICTALGLTLLRSRKHYNGSFEFEPDFGGRSWERWHYSNPLNRHPLPRLVPDVAAGVPAPSQLTKWKIAALQISAVIDIRGYVTRHDFRLAGIDHRRWTQDWLEPIPEKNGCWRWRKGVNQGFQHQHKVIYPQILAEVREKGLAAETEFLLK